jgi:antitoxin ParD1/3/4
MRQVAYGTPSDRELFTNRSTRSLILVKIVTRYSISVLAIVNILLTPEQAEIIQQKLQSGRYQNVDDAIDRAIQLLDEYEDNLLTEDPTWIANTQPKVDRAIDSLAKNGGSDGTIVVDRLLDKFRQARSS